MPRRSPTSKTTTLQPSTLIDPASDYARAVVDGKIVAGPLVRAACERHLRDLVDGPKRGLTWDIAAYSRIVGFFRDVLVLSDGEHSSAPFILQPFQVFILGNLFGWKGDDGYRRFRTAYVEVGKGAGKSPLAAGIALYMLTADGENGAECYAAAVTRDQARIMFRDAVRMAQASRALSRSLVLSGRQEVFNIAFPKRGSYFRPVSSEGRALDGKRVHFAAIDELHEHPNDTVVNKMRAGTKGRRQALIFEITNSGYDRTSVCYDHHEYSRKIVTGERDDDSWFGYVCGLDEGDDPLNDKSCWPKANPNIGVSITEKYLEEQVREAKGIPSKESLVRRLNFCQWVDAENPWIDGNLWLNCESEDFPESELEGMPCWGGLDLSGTTDLTAFCLAFPLDDGRLVLKSSFWMPKENVSERERKDMAPYRLWVDKGFITTTPGRSVDYRYVAGALVEASQKYDLQSVAFDPYRIKYLERDLEEMGATLELVPHGQGYYKAQQSKLWMPRSIELLEERVLKGSLVILKNPVLTWNSSCAVIESDPKGNRIFTKRKSTGRIDGLVASAMAIGSADGTEKIVRSFWETMDPSEYL